MKNNIENVFQRVKFPQPENIQKWMGEINGKKQKEPRSVIVSLR